MLRILISIIIWFQRKRIVQSTTGVQRNYKPENCCVLYFFFFFLLSLFSFVKLMRWDVDLLNLHSLSTVALSTVASFSNPESIWNNLLEACTLMFILQQCKVTTHYAGIQLIDAYPLYWANHCCENILLKKLLWRALLLTSLSEMISSQAC